MEACFTTECPESSRNISAPPVSQTGSTFGIPQNATTSQFDVSADTLHVCNRAREQVFSNDMLAAVQHAHRNDRLGTNNKLLLVSEFNWNQSLYRAHATWKPHGWFDWVMVRYERDPPAQRRRTVHSDDICQPGYPDTLAVQRLHDYAPGQIRGIVSTAESVDMCTAGNTHVVIESCDFAHQQSSVFTTQWRRAWTYTSNRGRKKCVEIVPVDSVVRHALMVAQDEDNAVFHEIWHPGLWADAFCSV